ncbi:MAG: hypothetical protein HXX20_02205 [Chloroflexi bacterium]|nr:hypothetical protein [Chloroflexota bacterium]
MELEEFLNQLKDVTGKLEIGERVAKAAISISSDASNAPGAAELLTKTAQLQAQQNAPNDAYDQKAAGNKMAEGFLKLARFNNKGWGYLGSDRVLENPRDWLRAKNIDGTFKVSDAELNAIIGAQLQAGKGNQDCPTFAEWKAMDRGTEVNQGDAISRAMQRSAKIGGFGEMQIQRALDTTSGAALVRTDIEPTIYEAVLREFPALEVIPKVAANGLKHTYDVRTGFGAATLIADMGDFSSAFVNSTFVRQENANIATIISPRAISLKVQYATRQSGMNFDLSGDNNLELMGAAWAIARLAQAIFLQGNYSTAAKTKDDEEGAYNALSSDGLRLLLRSNGFDKADGDSYIRTINRAVGQIANAGGSVRNLLIQLSYGARLAVNDELQNILRIMNNATGGPVNTNLSANGLVTIGDWPSRMQDIPSDAQTTGLGYYTYALNGGAAVTVEDINVIDPLGLAAAWLGSPTPTTLELPVGFGYNLSNVWIPFWMYGPVCHIPNFQRKIRIPRQEI